MGEFLTVSDNDGNGPSGHSTSAAGPAAPNNGKATDWKLDPSSGNSFGAAIVRPEGRSAEIVLFEAQVVSFFVDAAGIFGIPKSVAAIYGICFATPQPLSFADISERLEISQGSISQGLRVLKDVGALLVVGTYERREYFGPEVELRKLVSSFLEERLERQLNASNGHLQAMKKLIPSAEVLNRPSLGLTPSPTDAVDRLIARLKYIENWHQRARDLVPLARAFLKLN